MEAGIGGPFLVNVHLPATLPLHCQLERETGEGSRSSPLVVEPLTKCGSTDGGNNLTRIGSVDSEDIYDGSVHASAVPC